MLPHLLAGKMCIDATDFERQLSAVHGSASAQHTHTTPDSAAGCSCSSRPHKDPLDNSGGMRLALYIPRLSSTRKCSSLLCIASTIITDNTEYYYYVSVSTACAQHAEKESMQNRGLLKEAVLVLWQLEGDWQAVQSGVHF